MKIGSLSTKGRLFFRQRKKRIFQVEEMSRGVMNTDNIIFIS